MWGHEHWNLQNGPDIVTFGGKAGISGFYSTVDFRTNVLGVSYEQQIDMIKLMSFGTVWKTIQKKNLLELVGDTSSFLKIELTRVQNEKGYLNNVRGYGTFLGFDVVDPTVALKI